MFFRVLRLLLTGVVIGIALGTLTALIASTARAATNAANQDVVTIVRESAKHGLDPKLVAAIIKVESNWNHGAVGSVGEVGLLQLHPKFHKDTSLAAGIKSLAWTKKHCPLKEGYTWVVCHNQGVNRRPKFPYKHVYYRKVANEYEALKKASAASKD